MRRLLVFTVFACCLASPAWAQIGISPRILDVVLDQDGASHSFRLFNLSKQPYRVRVSVVNWSVDENNQTQPIPPEPSSLDQWMIVNPLNFTIPPGESQTVRVGFRPQSALPEGEYRALVYFDQVLPEDDDPERAQVRSRFRLGAAVYAHVGEVRPQASVDAIQINGDEVSVQITNSGNTHVRLDGQWTLWPAAIYPGPDATHQVTALGTEKEVLPEGVISAGWLPRAPVLPGFTRTVTFKLSELPEDAARLVLDMDAQFADQALDRAVPFEWAGRADGKP